MHSKVVTIDDRWATVGSANLDGVSLHSYGSDFRSAIGERVFRDVRNFDVNVVLDGDLEGEELCRGRSSCRTAPAPPPVRSSTT